MPQIQVLDLNPSPRTEHTPLEKTLNTFTQAYLDQKKENKSSDALKQIYSKFQQENEDGQNLQRVIQEIQTNLDIGPTQKVEAINQLMQMEKYNASLQKQSIQQIKAIQKADEEHNKAQEKAKKQADKQAQIRYLEKQNGLEEGSLEAFNSDPRLAQSITKPEKIAAGDRSINEDQIRRIQHTKDQPGFSELPLHDQELAFLKNGVSKSNADAILGREQKSMEIESKRNDSDRKYHSQVSRPIIEEANKTLKNYQANKGLRAQLRKDIESGETSGIYPFIIDKLGLESFRSPESARFTNEVKNLFVESLNDIPGARPNMFIERFLSNAQPSIGRSKEANLSVLDVGDFLEDLKAERAKQEIQIAKEDRAKFGYVKEDVAERAADRMGDFANKRQEQMAEVIQNRTKDQGSEKTKIFRDPRGNKWKMTQKQVDNAKAKGVIFEPVKE
jgi:hypothetical protein